MKTAIKSADTLLPALGVGLPIEFLSKLRIEEYLDQIDNKITLTNGERLHLGELFRTAELITSNQFDETIFQQWRDSRKQDEIRIEKNSLTQREWDVVREFQRCRAGTGSTSCKFALGNILVANGQITRPQLIENLEIDRLKPGDVSVIN